jgi:hypothetical protein
LKNNYHQMILIFFYRATTSIMGMIKIFVSKILPEAFLFQQKITLLLLAILAVTCYGILKSTGLKLMTVLITIKTNKHLK